MLFDLRPRSFPYQGGGADNQFYWTTAFTKGGRMGEKSTYSSLVYGLGTILPQDKTL
jgi:hypothetical protein